ncbi:MAG: flagellar hook-associated protein 1 FlgK [Alteromonadaceae bacterium]|jgi:flagellar hook-associated protein 1 FlgK
MADMLQIGTSGIMATSLLLETAGHNIANVNTPGHVLERVELSASPFGGIGGSAVNRVVSEFAQRQMRRDTASHSFYEQFVNEAMRVDTLFAGTANSVATSMDGFFQRLQGASDDPSSIAARQLVVSEAEGMLGTFNTLNSLVLDQATTINEQLDIFTNETNTLIQNIARLNKSVTGLGIANASAPPNALLSERDESLRKLSELIEINTLDGQQGEKLVFLNTGQSLILKDGDFSLFSINGNPDPNRKDLQLGLSTNSSLTVGMEANKVGSKIGGLLQFRQEVLEPTQNRLGQLALALTDAFNEQNKLGMDADGEVGANLFQLPTTSASGYAANTGPSVNVTSIVEPGKGGELTSSDFQIIYNPVAPAAAGNNFVINALDEQGAVVAGSQKILNVPAAFPITFDSTNSPGGNLFGLSITIDAVPNDTNEFLLKPVGNAASTIGLNSFRPEDIALAAPIRTEAELSNLGNGVISEGTVNNTNTATSNFTAPGGLTNDPVFVLYNGGNAFTIYDSDPRLGPAAILGSTGAMAPGQLNDIMAAGGPLTAGFGYDFSITGTPQTNDVFTVSYNTSGFNDNRNGLKLAGLQGDELMRKNVVSTAAADNTLTFHEAYARLVSVVGEKTARARSSEVAFEALLDQSTGWHQSISGVNLDEEAANLVRFQQAYSAAARVISVAQTTFETLLSAVR